MANIKISDLTAAAAATGTQEFEVNDSLTSKKVTGAQILAYVEGEISSSPSFTGQVSVDDGSASAPSITNTGDSNTGVYFPAADTVAIATGGTKRLEVNSSGTITASGNQVIEVTDNTNAALRITQLGTGEAIRVEDSSNPDSTPFVVDASGAVGVGTTTPIGKVDVTQSTGFSLFANHTSTDGYSGIGYYENGSNKGYQVHFGSTASGGERLETWLSSSAPLTFGTGNAERMRIDSSGNVMVGATALPSFGSSTTSGTWVQPSVDVAIARSGNCLALQRGATDGDVATFWRGTSQKGYIYVTSTGTTYNTLSDYRLKENVVPLTGASDRVMQLPVHRFNFVSEPGSTVDGFLAHEAQSVVPEAVIGQKDAVDENGKPVYQGIDQSKLVPLLTAALQEAITKINALEARVVALESA